MERIPTEIIEAPAANDAVQPRSRDGSVAGAEIVTHPPLTRFQQGLCHLIVPTLFSLISLSVIGPIYHIATTEPTVQEKSLYGDPKMYLGLLPGLAFGAYHTRHLREED